jgi:hypothetical protein
MTSSFVGVSNNANRRIDGHSPYEKRQHGYAAFQATAKRFSSTLSITGSVEAIK